MHITATTGTVQHHRAVRDSRRVRVLSAVTDIVCEENRNALTVAQITARSGVSARCFFDLFENTQQALQAAIEDSIHLASGRVISAYATGAQSWPDKVSAGVDALLTFLEQEPECARLCVLHGPTVQAPMPSLLGDAVRQANQALKETGERFCSREIAPLLLKGAVGEVYALIHRRLAEERRTEFIDLHRPLTRLLLAPFVNPDLPVRCAAPAAAVPDRLSCQQ